MSRIRARLGDSPMGLAARFTGEPARMCELVQANPHKPTVRLDDGRVTFQDLAAGETLLAPVRWQVRQFGSVTVSASQVAAHVMAPPNLTNAISGDGPHDIVGTTFSAGLPTVPLPKGAASLRMVPNGSSPTFKPKVFIDKMLAFRAQTNGYAVEVRQLGDVIASAQWGWALRPDLLQDGWAWTPTTPQDVASISKLWTAACMVKLLRERFPGQNAIDRPILPFIPQYWNTGPNIEQITFRLLLQHKTGLLSNVQGSGAFDFETMKYAIEAGSPSWPNGFDYKNCNYSLCRVLLAVLQGNMSANWQSEGGWVDTDKTWDLESIESLEGYVQQTLFYPAGVVSATLTRRAGSAYGYTFPASAPWNSGDLSVAAGAGGWHMTAREILDVLGYARRGSFLPSGVFDSQVLGPQFGIDAVMGTPLGPSWTKGGLLQNSIDGGQTAASLQTEQSAVFVLPQGLELAMLVNSPLSRDNLGLQGAILYAFIHSLQS